MYLDSVFATNRSSPRLDLESGEDGEWMDAKSGMVRTRTRMDAVIASELTH